MSRLRVPNSACSTDTGLVRITPVVGSLLALALALFDVDAGLVRITPVFDVN